MPLESTYKNTNFRLCKKPENAAIFQSLSSGKEKDSETGYYYFGARYYNSDLSIWLSVDPMSDKYPSLSPYNYCAWNPMKLVDPNGDSIMIKRQNQEKGDSQLLSSLSNKTGLNLYVNEKGRLVYEKGEDGSPCINGGSKTAREDVLKAISDNSFNIIVSYLDGADNVNAGKADPRSVEFSESRLLIDLADFTGNEPATFDIGMVFLHEFQHGYFGLSDNIPNGEVYSCTDENYYKRGFTGDAVNRVNIYRRELGLPTREAYPQSPYNGKIPFSFGGSTIWLNGFVK